MEIDPILYLLTACEEGATKIVHFLLEAGVNPNSHNDEFNALGLASMYGNYNIVDDLLKHGRHCV